MTGHSSNGRHPTEPQQGEAPKAPDGPTPVVVRVADVVPQRVRWLWPARIPLGKLTVLDGDPALGKSTLMVDITARVTTGTPWPDSNATDRRQPGAVVWMTAEDGIADTLRPRLEAAGADTTRVVVLDAIQALDEKGRAYIRPPVLPGDLPPLGAVIADTRAVLVVVDVLAAYLDARIDAHKDQAIRAALSRLGRLAEHTGCAIVVLRHLNKAQGGNPLYRGGGSIGIIAAARSGLLVAPDPNDSTRRILAPTKANLAQLPSALAYQLVSDEHWGCARIHWHGTTTHHASDLLTDPTEDRTSQDDALDWLHEVLAAGPLPADEVKTLARKAGFTVRTVERARARKESGVTTKRAGFGKGAVFHWMLTGASSSPPDAHARHPRQPSNGGEHGEHESTSGEHGGRDEIAGPDLFATEREK